MGADRSMELYSLNPGGKEGGGVLQGIYIYIYIYIYIHIYIYIYMYIYIYIFISTKDGV